MIRRVLWVTIAWTIGVTAAHGEAPFLRGGDDVVVPLAPARPCQEVAYAGPGTHLYADRPYHTRQTVEALVGLRFCRGKRHGRALWLLEVARPTRLFAVAHARHELERDGWRREPASVRVDAAGLALDGLYTKPLEPGLYAIRYGRARTAHPIFWDARDARIAAPPPVDD